MEDGEPVRARRWPVSWKRNWASVSKRARPLIQVRHDYADKHVLLDVWEVDGFSGEAHGAEGQPLAWVEPRELADYEFPPPTRRSSRPRAPAGALPDHPGRIGAERADQRRTQGGGGGASA
ncbi:hypothetical protein ACPA9J_28935 [Pseudomonas aeruginosa]